MVVPYTRRVAVYVPAQYVAGTPAPFIVVQDGMSATYRNNLPPILDNLIHEKRVPPMIAVMVHNGGGDAQGSQRGLEYDTVSGVYTDFIETEVLPRVSKEYGDRVHQGSRGPRDHGRQLRRGVRVHDGVVSPGAVSPGPVVFGDVRESAVAVEPRRHRAARGSITRRSSRTTRPKPIRIWMHVSECDNRYFDQEDTWHNWVLANDRMAAALKAKGYKYQYVYSRDSRHVDRAVVSQTLPEALEWLWKGYRPGTRP